MSQILPYQLEPEYPSSEEREDQESEEEQDEQDDSLVSNTGRRFGQFLVCLVLLSMKTFTPCTSTETCCGQLWSVYKIERVLAFQIGSKCRTGNELEMLIVQHYLEISSTPVFVT
ncbi:hypothetical protein OS493_029939 [Desmophyllum pertusum]|uniref:Uncharacterized protein n=1 Tax=Desmophyllum pertusum TaxID=174260 RepID=A0A9W9ZY45_9CNID|nr:hypothetical protein OS493_029939 [Desmophyllum pertusum]